MKDTIMTILSGILIFACVACIPVGITYTELEKTRMQTNSAIVINAQWARSVEYCADAVASIFGK